MSNIMTVQITKQGAITLPKNFGKTYNLPAGTTFILLDLGEEFLLKPYPSKVGIRADRIGQALLERGETLVTILQDIREQREQYDNKS